MKNKLTVFLLALLYSSSAFCDIFALTDKQNILYESKNALNEYLIYTPNKKCFVHYLSPKKIEDSLTLQIKNKSDITDVECLEKGFSEINILNSKNEIIHSLGGYFLDGFFIGGTPLNTYTIKRSAEENGKQYLYYYIDEDEELKIRYVGRMHSINIDGMYTAFEVCPPVEIFLQTSNKALFSEQDTIQNLFTVAKSYAQTLCPQVKTIVFSATDSPSLSDEGIFFREYLNKDDATSLWMPDLEQSFNYIMSPPTEKVEEKTILKKTQSIVKEENVKEEPKIQANTPKEDISLTTDEAVVHISEKSNKRVLFIDQPYLMKATQTDLTKDLKVGWYKIKANFFEMTDLEKKRTGISLNQKAATVEILSVTACNDKNCASRK